MKKTIILGIFILLGVDLYGQSEKKQEQSITVGLGIGVHNGAYESSLGLVYMVGWQQELGDRQRLRINPNMTFGSYKDYLTDTRDLFYRLSALGVDIHYDLVKYKGFSLVTSGGVFVSYSRGLMGTGDFEGQHHSSDYFTMLYGGAKASVGIRYDPKQGRIAYELIPATLALGNSHYAWLYPMAKINIKLF
ncbi:hypothetical protein DN752_03440 [Echinicola strongylocentroti]|uniref:Outer membrane protein beta-barrel domain-containing protein n=1 Tax=Echinicola strongylocentroti TaxID=1795355 RepID=A0A2Z4IES5_9BACT|nr:hypothetical protein [Echinicola strongylocentroti]AWW29269.1 hypothetical protein DN752_03440 [Echinicola strongylocentroti]